LSISKSAEKLRCGIIQKVIYILQLMSAGSARRILILFYPASLGKRKKKVVTMAAKKEQFTVDEAGEGPV